MADVNADLYDGGVISGFADSPSLSVKPADLTVGGLDFYDAFALNGVKNADFFQLTSGGATDNVAPVVSNVSPPVNTDLSPNSSIAFDVTDDVGMQKIVVLFRFLKSAIWEAAYDGTSFAPNYDGSTVTPISGGFHFTFQRVQGYPSRPSIRIIALDTSGNEAN